MKITGYHTISVSYVGEVTYYPAITITCLASLFAGKVRGPHLAPAITERGTPGWTLVAGGYTPDRVISDRSIGPLVRLGLIALAVDLPVRMIVTAQGKETWALFCQRGGMYPEDLTDI